MGAAPKRRWLRFSLQMMFVAFTAVAAWLGWNVYTVEQRQRVLSSMRSDPAYHLVTARWVKEKRIPSLASYVEPPLVAEVSVVRGLLGDIAIQTIYHAPNCPDADVRHVMSVFPEAEVVAAQTRPNPPRTNGRAHSDL